ncbi:sensor with HAMP domain protein, partial [bacterium]|nr:sensor with HAMP domain protein [bacterium]
VTLASICLIVAVMQRIDYARNRERLLKELLESRSQVKQLEGIIPICSCCKKIRDSNEEWQQLEIYIHNHSDANFSHGMCPECAKKFRDEL